MLPRRTACNVRQLRSYKIIIATIKHLEIIAYLTIDRQDHWIEEIRAKKCIEHQ